MKKILLFSFFLSAIYVYGQKAKADSLKIILTKEKSDTEKVNLMVQIANFSEDTAEQNNYCRQAIQLAEQKNFQKGLAMAYTAFGINCFDRSDFLNAVYYYTEALRLFLSIKDRRRVAMCYHELGLLDDQFENYNHALQNFKSAMAINLTDGNARYLRNNYQGMATVFGKLNELDSAILYSKKAEVVALKNNLSTAVLYLNMSGLYLDKKVPDSCEYYLLKSDSSYRALNNDYGPWWIKLVRGELLLYQDKAEEAVPLLENVYHFADENSDGELLFNVIPQLLKAYHATNNSLKGFSLQDQWIEMKDSMVSSQKVNKANAMQLKLEMEMKEKVLQLQKEKKDAETKASMDKQKLFLEAVIVVAVLLLVLITFVTRSYLQKKRAHLAITSQKEEIEKQKQIVDEKQKEIIDSIHYAKRIQQALLPTEKYIAKHLDKKS